MDIKNVIQQRGLLMSQAAEMMGITPQALSQIVNGNPTVKKIEALAKAIGCSPAEFFADWQGAGSEAANNIEKEESQEKTAGEKHDELPFDGNGGTDEAKPTAQGMYVCPHCGKGVTFVVQGE